MTSLIILAVMTLTNGFSQTSTPPELRTGANVASIPARPEQLKYPPFTYEPPDPKEFRVALKSGPIAYVVPDRELPLVNIAIYVRTGNYLQPQGKEGLADLTGYLLARGGTKSRTAEEMEERLAFLAAQLNSGIGATDGNVTLNLLSKDLDEGLGILREVLTSPRFQDDKITLRKQQMFQEMQQRNDESAAIEARERAFLAFGENFWLNRYPTAESLKSLSRDDIEMFHEKWFHPANFIVAASGDFDRDAMIQKLEALFADWPFKGEMPPAIPTNTVFSKPGIYVVNKDVNQGRVAIMLPGITRDDPDYFSATVMNDILGGGGFTSRIVNRVRSDEGLAYDARSTFPGGVYYPMTFTAGFQSKSRTVLYAIQLIKEELKRIASQPVQDAELNISKRAFIDRFPRTFSTKAQVANVFAQDELTGRFRKDPEFWKKYRSRIDAVNTDEVRRVAQRFIDGKNPAILIVGDKEEILKGHPNHPVSLGDIAVGEIHDVPLRDPLTMKPMK